MLEWVVDGELVAVGTEEEPITMRIFADAPEVSYLHNPTRQWGPMRFKSTEDVTLEHVVFEDLLPRDQANIPPDEVFVQGQPLIVSWTTAHLDLADRIRIRVSTDSGSTFDTRAPVPASDGTYSVDTSAFPVGTSVVIRAEFVESGPADPDAYAIGFDDFPIRVVEALPVFTDVSSQTNLTLPGSFTQSSSVTLDFDHDGKEDLLVSFSNSAAMLNAGAVSGLETPSFEQQTALLGNGLITNTTGVIAADFLGGDGHVDLFIGAPSGNLLLAGDGEDFSESETGEDYDKSSWLGSGQMRASRGASFGDFNADGWLDLYLMSSSTLPGEGDLLLQSDGGTGFVDVTAAAGLPTDRENSQSAVWADLNDDGRLDLVVGYGGVVEAGNNGWSPLYLNMGETSGQVTFSDVAGATSGPRMNKIGHIQGIEVADITGDQVLDLVMASNDLSAPTTLVACVNDGAGVFTQDGPALGLNTSTPLLDVEVSDLSGNGVLDIVAVPDGAADVVVFSGFGDASSRGFRDATLEASLGANPAYGLTVADFNGDADADIFLLRPKVGSVEQFFWANGLRDGGADPPPPASSYTVEFAHWPGTLNPNFLGIGAMVTSKVITPSGQTLYSTQIMDGGSGRAGQGSRRRVFGLAGASTAEITVKWPHGYSQVFDAASSPGFPNVILKDTTNPSMMESTVSASYVPSYGYTIHTFTWETWRNLGTPQVLIQAPSKSSSDCKVPLVGDDELLLEPGLGGVGVPARVWNPTTSRWINTLTWTAYCSSPCNYYYYARSVVGGQVYSASRNIHFVGACAISIP